MGLDHALERVFARSHGPSLYFISLTVLWGCMAVLRCVVLEPLFTKAWVELDLAEIALLSVENTESHGRLRSHICLEVAVA